MHFVLGKTLLFTLQIIYCLLHSLGLWPDLIQLLIGSAARVLCVYPPL